MFNRILVLIIGYIIGMFQTGYIYGKTKGIDIRTRGSGNAGSTNALRVFGLKAGVVTFIGDFLKCLIPCLIVKHVFNNDIALILWTGLGIVLGHDFPFVLNFKGGKGIAASAAIVFAINWKAGLAAIAVWILLVAITKYVSLSSMIVFVATAILGIVFLDETECRILCIILTGLALFRHCDNIKRLINGTENKFSIGEMNE